MSRVIVDNKSFSLSEWYQQINHQLTHGLRAEDNKKRERLEVLFKTIGLRYDRPDKFTAETVVRRQPEFLTYLKKNKNRFCAFRLVPQDAALPKLRMRGKTVSEALKWLDGQSVDFSKYNLEIVPHSEVTLWASIFMIQPQGIIGEIVQGGLNLLSMGQATTRPIFFKSDFKRWHFSEKNQAVAKIVQRATAHLLGKDRVIQQKLKRALKAKFINDYLAGYFEFFIPHQPHRGGAGRVWPDKKICFSDYNRLLPALVKLDDFILLAGHHGLSGVCAFRGRVRGKVRSVKLVEIGKSKFSAGDILVCEETSPDYLPLMKRAGAIVTDRGGLLSHAAIIARELKIPCIVGTVNATKILKDDETIVIDADAGVIKRI